MLRFVTLLALAASAAAVAAPVPPPSEKEVLARHWGKTEGQGEFELKGKRLTLRTAVPPDQGIHGDGATAPRATRTVTGDFVMTVTVVDAALPHPNAATDSRERHTRAGLFVAGGGYHVQFHLYQAYHENNGVVQKESQRCVWVDAWFPGGGSGSMLKATEDGKSTHLRVARKDKVVTVSYSFDGKEWSAPYTERKEMDFPDEVTVGVFLSHSTHQTLDATFDAFTVEKPKDEKPR